MQSLNLSLYLLGELSILKLCFNILDILLMTTESNSCKEATI